MLLVFFISSSISYSFYISNNAVFLLEERFGIYGARSWSVEFVLYEENEFILNVYYQVLEYNTQILKKSVYSPKGSHDIHVETYPSGDHRIFADRLWQDTEINFSEKELGFKQSSLSLSVQPQPFSFFYLLTFLKLLKLW